MGLWVSKPVARYDVFISYSRADTFTAVSAIGDAISNGLGTFSGAPVRIYLDPRDIHSRRDWKRQSLPALGNSRVMVMCLSPNYRRSEYCAWDRAQFGGPVYFVELAEGPTEGFVAWFPDGVGAYRSAEVRRRIATSGSRDRRGNVRAPSERFVGRINEIAELRSRAGGTSSALTVLHGVGGMGKTELAVAYANAFGDLYPAGTWLANAEGFTDPLVAVAQLDQSAIRVTVGKRELRSLGERVLARLRVGCLLILDNATNVSVLTAAQVLASWPGLHIIVTTRFGPGDADAVGWFAIPPLTVSDGTALMGTFHGVDADAAREIAELVDGYPLALDLAAVRLAGGGETPSRLRAALRDNGPRVLDDVAAGALICYREGATGAVADQTLVQLPQRAREVVEIASFLPPERIPWGWLQVLSRDMPTSDDPEWPSVQALLEGRGLLLRAGGPGHTRLHRVLGQHFRSSDRAARYRTRLESLLRGEAGRLHRSAAPPADELAYIATTLTGQLMDSPGSRMSLASAILVLDTGETRLDLTTVRELAVAAIHAGEMYLETKSNLRERAVPLIWCSRKVGNVYTAQGDSVSALAVYERSLALVEERAVRPEEKSVRAEWPRALADVADALAALGEWKTALERYERATTIAQQVDAAAWDRWALGRALVGEGDMHLTLGAADMAQDRFGRALAIIEGLTSEEPDDASARTWLHLVLERIGDSLVAAGKLDAAQGVCRRALAITEELFAADDNATRRHNLAVSLNKMAAVLVQRKQWSSAAGLFERSVALCETQVVQDPTSARAREALWECLIKAGEALAKMTDHSAALVRFRRAFVVAEALGGTAIPAQRRLGASHVCLALALGATGDPDSFIHRRAAEGIFAELRSAGKLSVADRNWLDRIERRGWKFG